MSLRNKLAILSFTLMSLMTIPTLAENDASSVNSRIENANNDVQIKTPEGWSETKDFNHSIPETFKLNGLTYRGLQFKNGTEYHGCAVFFAENDDEADDNDDDLSALENTLNQAQELAFPGSKPTDVITFSEYSYDSSGRGNWQTDKLKFGIKGTIDGNILKASGDSSKFTISGALQVDTAKGNFAIGTGQIVTDGIMPFNGTTAVQFGSDHKIIILMWGTDETVQMRDAYRFLEAVTVTARAPVEPVTEPVIDIVVISEPVVVIVEEVAQVTPVASEQVVVVETAPTPVTTDAVAATEEAVKATPVAVETAQVAPATTEEAAPVTPVAVETAQAAPATSETVVAAEEAAPVIPVATEGFVAAEEVVQATPETPAA